MQKSIAKESPRRRIARRVGAAGLALAAVLTLGGCKATGGGYIDDPLPGGVLPVGDIDGTYQGEANFGFNYTCEMNESANKAVIKGEITYHDSPSTIDVPAPIPGDPPVETDFPEIRIHGTVEPIVLTNIENCEMAEGELFNGVPAARFDGTYRSQDATFSAIDGGEFTVLVGDQGEPGHPQGIFDGDLFSIELFLGPHNGYTRGGYIEGGNIQVD
jgi:hypothetical protein